MIPETIKALAIPLIAFAGMSFFSSSCPPPAVPAGSDASADAAPTMIDSSIASCQTACDAMKRVGCVVLSDCAAVMCKVNVDPRFAHYNTTCLTHALVPGDVWACGTDCKLDQ